MKNIFYFILILISTNSMAQELDLPLITITGSAVIFENPDEVLISISIYKKDMELSIARQAYQKQSIAVIKFLLDSGIKENHIQTHHAFVGPKRKRHSTEIDHYYASQTINVCIRDLKKYTDIVDGLVDLDVHKVGQATFRTDKIAERRNEALKLAIKDAMSKAKMLAQEIGQEIGKAKIIEEIPNTKTSFNAETYGSSTETITRAKTAEGFAPGQLEIKSVVKVSFELL